MTTRAALIGDGATNGTTVSTTNSGRKAGVPVDAVSIGTAATLTYDTSLAYHGTASVHVVTGGSVANCFARWDAMYRPADGAPQVATMWLYQTAYTATSSVLMVTNASIARIIELRITGTGKARVLNGAGTQILETTNSIALNQWVRVDLLFTPHASAGTAQVKLYNNPASSTPTESTSLLTGQNLRQTQVEQTYLGNTIGALSQNVRMQAVIGDGSPPPFGAVGWVMSRWLGAVTEDSVGVAARVMGATSVRLVVSTASNLATSPSYSSGQTPDSDGTVRMAVTGLADDTQYYYGIECDGVVDTDYNGSFRTAPTPGTQASFTFTAASCAQNNSNATVYDTIRGDSPRFHAHLGDLHYRDITTNDQPAIHKAIDQVMSGPRYARLLGEVPTPYIWSDHDSVGPNGDSSSAALPAANAVYRSRVPSHSLPTTTGTYFAFTWGRIRCVFTDGRSFMDPIADTDDASKTKLGSTQLAWLIAELTDPDYPVKLWFHEDAVSNGTTFPGDDTWSAYATERATIFSAIAGQNVAIISGDLHMVAADDGTNVPTAGAASGIPVYVVSPMDNTSFGGNGTYSSGEYPAVDGTPVNLYGLFEITDSGSSIELDFIGKDAGGTSRVTQTVTWTGLADAVTGDLAGTLPALQGSVAGKVAVSGTIVGTLPAATGSAAGAVTVAGAMAGTLPAAAGSATGNLTVTGQIAGTLPALQGASSGVVHVTGTLAGTLPALTVGLAGTVSVHGAVAGVLPAVTGSAVGNVTVSGLLAGTLAAITGSAVGAVTVSGALAGNLPALTGSLTGTAEGGAGSLNGILPAAQGAFTGALAVTGSVAGALPAVTGALIGEVEGASGTLTGVLPSLTGGFAAIVAVRGTLAGTLPSLTAAFTAQAGSPTGVLTAVLPAITGTFAGHSDVNPDAPTRGQMAMGTRAGPGMSPRWR